MVNLFKGEYGDLFTGRRLSGATRQGPASMTVYMALYASGPENFECRCLGVVPDAMTAQVVARQVQGLRLSPADIAAQYMQVVRLSDALESRQAVEDVAVHVALRALGGLDLPVAFVMYLSMLDDGSQKVVLFYPAVAPGPVLLEILQREAAKEFLR
jgi:hypothetical protein